LAVKEVANLVGDTVFLHGAYHEFSVIDVIFDEHDENRFSNHIRLLAFFPCHFEF
jgi:hypothetical protein